MITKIKYAMAAIFGTLYTSSIWTISMGPERISVALFVISGLCIFLGTVWMLCLVAWTLVEHWNDDK